MHATTYTYYRCAVKNKWDPVLPLLNLLFFSMRDITGKFLYPPILARSIWAAQNPICSFLIIWLMNSLLIDIQGISSIYCFKQCYNNNKNSLNIFLPVHFYLSFFLLILPNCPLKYMMYLFILHQLFQEGMESIFPLLPTLYAINSKTFFC